MPFSGSDVLALGIAPGPAVGNVLQAFERWWIEAIFHPMLNSRAECLKSWR